MECQPILSWEEVEAQLQVVLSQALFDQGTIDNASDLIGTCRFLCVPPDGVTKGYWDTVSMSWSMSWPKLEIEVFPDRLEFYRFHDRGGTDIEEYQRRPGEPISKDLVGHLPKFPDIST
jgi:hypothetical protein